MPDLDLRVARQGIRIANGASRLNLDAFPTMLQRLDLEDPGSLSPPVMVHRNVHFQVPAAAGDVCGRIDFLGYEGFRLTLRWPTSGKPTHVCLWTRKRIHEHWELGAEGGEVACVLMPGHYFVGMAADEEPVLALSVEPELLTPRALAACGYAACRAGRFSSALSSFEQASRLAPEVEAYGSMARRTRSLARRFDLAERDVDILWEMPQGQSTPADLPPTVALGEGERTTEQVVALVEALRRQSEPTRAAVRGPAVIVSRRRFRPAYASMMQWLWASLEALSSSVESPISCP
jgi:hypothetical protein